MLCHNLAIQLHDAFVILNSKNCLDVFIWKYFKILFFIVGTCSMTCLKYFSLFEKNISNVLLSI